MCLKIKYGTFRIDPCLQEEIEQINKAGIFKTLSSCCGHGKYHKTIVVKAKSGKIFELFSKIELGKRKRNRYYKKDKEGYYYIPEIVEYYKGILIIFQKESFKDNIIRKESFIME